jgi:hypothetical protein
MGLMEPFYQKCIFLADLDGYHYLIEQGGK